MCVKLCGVYIACICKCRSIYTICIPGVCEYPNYFLGCYWYLLQDMSMDLVDQDGTYLSDVKSVLRGNIKKVGILILVVPGVLRESISLTKHKRQKLLVKIVQLGNITVTIDKLHAHVVLLDTLQTTKGQKVVVHVTEEHTSLNHVNIFA